MLFIKLRRECVTSDVGVGELIGGPRSMRNEIKIFCFQWTPALVSLRSEFLFHASNGFKRSHFAMLQTTTFCSKFFFLQNYKNFIFPNRFWGFWPLSVFSVIGVAFSFRNNQQTLLLWKGSTRNANFCCLLFSFNFFSIRGWFANWKTNFFSTISLKYKFDVACSWILWN